MTTHPDMLGVVAVDGGNSKTELALVAADGALLARVRAPGSSPHALGVSGSLAVVHEALELALTRCGSSPATPPVAAVGAFFLAGLDEPDEERAYADALVATGWVGDVEATNDTFAVLHAGTSRDWGVAVVCGAGINACGVAPDGQHGRYQALGELSGDWGGGEALGIAAVGAAIRANDGRGPASTLSRLVPTRLGYPSAEDVADAVHKGRLPGGELTRLAPDVLAAAQAGDVVAQELVDRLGDEVAVMVTALLHRLDLVGKGTDVVLGGGLLQSGDERLLTRVVNGIGAVDPSANARALTAPPLLGAIRSGLRRLGAGDEALERARAELMAWSEKPG
jgi:N-acetylglucosamine kinase-like BadF-type ATPase